MTFRHIPLALVLGVFASVSVAGAAGSASAAPKPKPVPSAPASPSPSPSLSSAPSPSPSPSPAPVAPTPTATAAPYYTDTVDASGVHQIALYNGATPPAASFPNSAPWYNASVSWTMLDGTPRQYQVAIPATLAGPAPYVIALHAYAQGVSAARTQQNWEALAPTSRFAVVYGVGQPNASWNAGQCCSTAASTNRTDSQYISELLRLVSSQYPMDPRAVFLAGFSNGGMMAYRYACEHPGQVAAVGVVAGTNEAACTPGSGTGAVAVRHIHGDADTTVPYNGSDFSTFLNCPLTPVPTTLRQWQAADAGSTWATVDSTLIPGMGHTWPSGTTYGIDATSTLWSFFASHHRP